ncbi:uncharacterized protein LOC142350440 isoform X2 [Convolutriloba macropyga]|uniref:uncharacterized protein LOC142350440 isoform X2 n=1 Tax=Convolutriloba macropyga TaxID=536237 RepID=UPI003F5218D9
MLMRMVRISLVLICSYMIPGIYLIEEDVATTTLMYKRSLLSTPQTFQCEDLCATGERMTQIQNCQFKKMSNGCGPEKLQGTFLSEIMDMLTTERTQTCCNIHDACYGTCGTKFEECESQFRRCLRGFYKVFSWITSRARP